MGQQQILFLLLGICIFGIAISVGVITLQNEFAPDNREVLKHELQALGAEAQAFYRRSIADGGGDGSFLGLSPGIEGISMLTSKHSTADGDFFIKRAGDLNSVELMAIGTERGIDARLPVRLVMTVWAESTAVQVLN